ncbi:hypothetical protein HK099_001196, partial [Clydaea vesicula]
MLLISILLTLYYTSHLQQLFKFDKKICKNFVNHEHPASHFGNGEGEGSRFVIQNAKIKIASIDGHQATRDDFRFISEVLKFNYTLYHPRYDLSLNLAMGQTKKFSNLLNYCGTSDFFCDTFDVVIVSDINTDARFLLERLDKDFDQPEMKRCKIKKLILLTTNRFDVGLRGWDKEEYYQTIKNIQSRNDKRLIFVANNPFEEKYAKSVINDNVGIKYEYMIRPFGISYLKDSRVIAAEEKKIPIFLGKDNYNNKKFFKKLKSILKENVTLAPHHYGGPNALKQYEAVIELPYQVSTMKNYENLRAGVVMYIPSPKFFYELETEVLKFNYTLYHPRYDLSLNLAMGGTSDFFCDTFDVVIVSDINTDARFLLERLDKDFDQPEMKRCKIKKLILLTTNRFDVGLRGWDKEEYYQTIKNIQSRNDKRLIFVANNPFEEKYAKSVINDNVGIKYEYMIRPFGISYLKDSRVIAAEEKKIPIFLGKDNYNNKKFFKKLKSILKENVTLAPHHYGGPNALKQYEAVIELPYQVSTMKNYENLRAG